MTIISWGFQGTIDEVQWAKHAQLLGNEYAVGPGLVPVAVAGARQVRIPVGLMHGKGITSEVTASEVVTLPTPAAGQWHLIVLRRSWASKTAQLVTLAAAATAMPLVGGPPATFPAERQATPGSTDDMPVCWVHVNGADTTLVVVPLLQQATSGRGPRWVASDRARDALIPSPVQGDTVLRGDTGWEERYYGLYNANTNPAGATPAGWYPLSNSLILCTLTRAAAYNLTGSFVAIPWDTEDIKTVASMHSQTVNVPRLIAPVTGIYRAFGRAQGDMVTDSCIIRIAKNGVLVPGTEQGGPANASSNPYPITEATFRMTAGDYVTIDGLGPGVKPYKPAGMRAELQYVGPPLGI